MKYFLSLILLLVPVEVLAACHLYILPPVGTGDYGKSDFKNRDPRRAKYIEPTLYKPVAKYSTVFYGFQPTLLVAIDISDAQEAELLKANDVMKIPDNLDATVSAAALPVVQKQLEDRFIPGNWVTTNTTYRTVTRSYIAASDLFQRYAAVSGNTNVVLDGVNVTLETQFNSLPAQARIDLQAAAKSLGLDISGIVPSSTMRSILMDVGTQLIKNERIVGCATI